MILGEKEDRSKTEEMRKGSQTSTENGVRYMAREIWESSNAMKMPSAKRKDAEDENLKIRQR